MPNETASQPQGTLALRVTDEWRGQLNQRVQAYRARRRKLSGENDSQAELPFQAAPDSREHVELALDEESIDRLPVADDFAFTIAIGRLAKTDDATDAHYFINVSRPAFTTEGSPNAVHAPQPLPRPPGMLPVAPLDERRSAAWIDAACLAFAYGGFLTLFGSLGGHFTLSKLTATVCFFTFAFVYVQYFGLFTIFGGTTPGMMIRGLKVTTFAGEEPSLHNLLLRAAGYMLSAGTLFMGFLWAMWDEDALSWHDRISGTYLTTPEYLSEAETPQPMATR